MNAQIKSVSGKKRSIWLLLLPAALCALGGYFYLYPEALPEWAKKTAVGRDLRSTTVYKWQDATGAWQISDRPPPAGTEYQLEKYSQDANVLPLPPALQR